MRDQALKQFVHTAWSEKEGAPGGILALAQTQDGYLWLGTDSGLYRFDGVSFEHYKPQSGATFPVGPVYSLLSLPNGDLWIGFDDGKICFLRNGTTIDYTTLEGVPRGRILGFEQDRDGTLWAATSSGPKGGSANTADKREIMDGRNIKICSAGPFARRSPVLALHRNSSRIWKIAF